MQKNEIVRVTVEEINNLGCGVAHLENTDGSRGQVVFIRDAVSGDVVDARIIKVNKSYLVAKIEKMITPSPLRCTADCTAAGCGGCVYRHVQYEHERKLKRDYVENAFRKAGLGDVCVEDVRHTGELVGYRNKAQYPVTRDKDGRVLIGFYAAGSHRVIPCSDCSLQPEPFANIVRIMEKGVLITSTVASGDLTYS